LDLVAGENSAARWLSFKNTSKPDLGAWGAWVPHFSRSLREVGPLTYSSRQAQARAHVHPLTGVEIGGALGEGWRVSAQIPTSRKQREKWGTRPQIPTSRKQREKWGTRRFIKREMICLAFIRTQSTRCSMYTGISLDRNRPDLHCPSNHRCSHSSRAKFYRQSLPSLRIRNHWCSMEYTLLE
jgi:hypothetical protein